MVLFPDIRKMVLGALITLFVFGAITIYGNVSHADQNTFVPLVGIPNVSNSGNIGLPGYINAIYILIIIIGAIIAVVKISIAGVKWSMSEVVTDKTTARRDILGALFGLALLLLPFTVLKTINPELVRLDVLRNAPKIDMTRTNPGSGSNPNPVNNATINPTINAVSNNYAQAFQDCICSGKEWDYISKVCKSAQVKNPSTACNDCGRNWSNGTCSFSGAQTLVWTQVLSKSSPNYGAQVGGLISSCSSIGGSIKTTDAGQSTVLECVK